MHYQMNKEEITLEFCINKDKPELRCDGKCHLAKKLEQEPSYSIEINQNSKKVPVPEEKLRIQEDILFISDCELFLSLNEVKGQKVKDLYKYLLSEAHLNQLDRPPSAKI